MQAEKLLRSCRDGNLCFAEIVSTLRVLAGYHQITPSALTHPELD